MTDLRKLAEANIWHVKNPSDWHREMRGRLVDAGIDLHEHTDATLALCDAEMAALRNRVAELEEALGDLIADADRQMANPSHHMPFSLPKARAALGGSQ